MRLLPCLSFGLSLLASACACPGAHAPASAIDQPAPAVSAPAAAPALRYVPETPTTELAMRIEKVAIVDGTRDKLMIGTQGVNGWWDEPVPTAYALGEDLYLLVGGEQLYVWDRSRMHPLGRLGRVSVPGLGQLFVRHGREGAYELLQVDPRGPWLERVLAVGPPAGQRIDCSLQGALRGAPLVACVVSVPVRDGWTHGRDVTLRRLLGPGVAEEHVITLPEGLHLTGAGVRGDRTLATGPAAKPGVDPAAPGKLHPHDAVGVYVVDLLTGTTRHVGDGFVGETQWTGGIHPCFFATWADGTSASRDPGCGVVRVDPETEKSIALGAPLPFSVRP